MKLCEKFSGNERVEYVISKMREVSKTKAFDVICAYNLFAKLNKDINAEAENCLDLAFVMCKYMKPEAEDVISMILCYNQHKNQINMRAFEKNFAAARYEQYFISANSARAHAPRLSGKEEVDSIKYFIMMRVCDRMFKTCNRALNHDHETMGAGCAQNAYETLKKRYAGMTRSTGEPYIVPHIRVASILVDMGAESTVVAAALLQDAADGIKYTVEEIEERIGKCVAQYVEILSCMKSASLTSCRMTHGKPEENTAYSDADMLMKAIGKNERMISALCIKAANIIYNLSMASSADEAEKYDIENGVQKEYIPMLKNFKLKCFLDRIYDLTWRAADVARYAEVETAYREMLAKNWESISKFTGYLTCREMSDRINELARLQKCGGYVIEVRRRDLLPYEVYECVFNSNRRESNNLIDKKTVPVCNIDIILTPRDKSSDYKTFVSCFIPAFNEKVAVNLAAIIDFEYAEDGNLILYVEDRYSCIFRLRIIKRTDYLIYRTGISSESVVADEKRNNSATSEHILVELKNGAKIPMPKGATVIDVAFAIHEELGYALRSAIVNRSRVSVYRRLENGDHVIIEADTSREDGATKSFTPHARLEWLKWVVTDKAKNKLIDFLSYKYEGDNVRHEGDAYDGDVERSSDKILGEIQWPV